jgi:hypothetical protein
MKTRKTRAKTRTQRGTEDTEASGPSMEREPFIQKMECEPFSQKVEREPFRRAVEQI